uniref:RRM domain-containing protein n=1 Tax=Cyanistes caeruleus TaxID=156563 RepID=A0A8C0VVY0_CYACU
YRDMQRGNTFSERATRNLFIGNLDHNVSEVELRRAFEKYGIIEEVVIKRPARGQGGAYAFLKFQNLDMAHRAKALPPSPQGKAQTHSLWLCSVELGQVWEGREAHILTAPQHTQELHPRCFGSVSQN